MNLTEQVFTEQEKYKKSMQKKKNAFCHQLDIQSKSVDVWQSHKHAMTVSSSYIHVYP